MDNDKNHLFIRLLRAYPAVLKLEKKKIKELQRSKRQFI